MTIDNDTERAFIVELYNTTQGDLSVKTTMKDVGAAIGLDKEQAGKVAEELIGKGYVEIKTLSGGIGITAEGAETARAMGAAAGAGSVGGARLSKGPVLTDDDRQSVEAVMAGAKQAVGRIKTGYAGLEQIVIHIKTIEVYLLAPRPATAAIKALLAALKDTLGPAGAEEMADRINQVL